MLVQVGFEVREATYSDSRIYTEYTASASGDQLQV